MRPLTNLLRYENQRRELFIVNCSPAVPFIFMICTAHLFVKWLRRALGNIWRTCPSRFQKVGSSFLFLPPSQLEAANLTALDASFTNIRKPRLHRVLPRSFSLLRQKTNRIRIIKTASAEIIGGCVFNRREPNVALFCAAGALRSTG